MPAHERATRNRGVDDRDDELKALRTACRRQAWAIETLTQVIANLRSGCSALKAENADLRAAGGLAHPSLFAGVGPRGCAEVCVPLDGRAPGAAQIVVAHVLGNHVAASTRERAKRVISELVSDSVRRTGVSPDSSITIRVGRGDGGVWLEVDGPVRDAVGAQGAPGSPGVGGFGSDTVRGLCERWGADHSAPGRTRVWAQLSERAADSSPDFTDHDGARAGRAGAAPGAVMQLRPQRRAAGSEVHVVPQPRAATWAVYDDEVTGVLSEHTSETDAVGAARAHARRHGASRIVVHDRYHRTHSDVLQRAQ